MQFIIGTLLFLGIAIIIYIGVLNYLDWPAEIFDAEVEKMIKLKSKRKGLYKA